MNTKRSMSDKNMKVLEENNPFIALGLKERMEFNSSDKSWIEVDEFKDHDELIKSIMDDLDCISRAIATVDRLIKDRNDAFKS